MAAFGLEIVGVTLSVLGWILGIVCCAMPMWRVTAFIGTNIVTAQVYWEGIWMSCVVQSTGQMQCKVYDSMLALPMDLQAARALVVVSIILGVLALLVAIMGAKCTNCIDDEATKARVMISSGAAFITAGVMLLIPVSWSAHTIILEFYSQVVPEAQKMEIGASLYLGWAAAALLLIGDPSCAVVAHLKRCQSTNPKVVLATHLTTQWLQAPTTRETMSEGIIEHLSLS